MSKERKSFLMISRWQVAFGRNYGKGTEWNGTGNGSAEWLHDLRVIINDGVPPSAEETWNLVTSEAVKGLARKKTGAHLDRIAPPILSGNVPKRCMRVLFRHSE